MPSRMDGLPPSSPANNRDMSVKLANYSRREVGTDTDMHDGVSFLGLNRTETMEAMFETSRTAKPNSLEMHASSADG